MERNQEHKADGGKLRLELIPTTAINSLGKVLTYGAKKYEPNSWQRVERDRYVGAALRHFTAYMDDPTGRDEESGLLHIEHALCNMAFLNHFAHDTLKWDEYFRTLTAQKIGNEFANGNELVNTNPLVNKETEE